MTPIADEPRSTPWWRKLAAYACLLAIFANGWWFTRLADRASPGEVAAATPGYSVTLIVIAGCMVALLIGIYDVTRLRYLAQVHESTVSAVAKTDADFKIVSDSSHRTDSRNDDEGGY